MGVDHLVARAEALSGRAARSTRSEGPANGALIRARGAGSLPGLFDARLRRSPEQRAYMAWDSGQGAWREYSWRDIGERAGRFRAALQATGLQKGERVALLLPNGIDWVAFDMGALSLGLVVVPLYLRDGVQNQARILAQSGASVLLVDTVERWARIMGAAGPRLAVRHVWVGEARTASLPPAVRPLGEVLSASGAWTGDSAAAPGDLATLIYTSGTTGAPKGVMLTHEAILWNAEAVTKLVAPTDADLFLSILPLAHAFERTVGHYLPMMAGATVAYARSITSLRDDLAELRPTVLLAVPSLYERALADLLRQAASWPFGAQLVRLAARAGWRRLRSADSSGAAPSLIDRATERSLRRWIGDRLLSALGGGLRVAVSGGAPLAAEVGRSLVGLGVPLVEGYGLTEAGPVVTGSSPEDYFPGSAGRPLEGAEVRLSECGELLVRSPAAMQGYWRNPQATAAAFEDGWLKTGDVAEIRDGRVFMRGRLNDVVVLATGEKFDPEPVEAAILRDPLFAQACVVGAARPYAVAVLVLAEKPWRRLAQRLSLDPARPNADVARMQILSRIEGALAGFPRFAQIRKIHVATKAWTVEAGLLTPTFKVKRFAVARRYAHAIADLYAPHAAFD
jgi:long-chain acyl-CoA synthetase